jgi:FtsP/CotA-like multicopper oxidase with cupredoxin domain
LGGVAAQPPDRFSSNGLLSVGLSFRASVDPYGGRRYCYIAGDGSEAPTLRVKPGDEVVLKLKNDLQVEAAAHGMNIHGPCGGEAMTAASTNLHFHGLSIPPSCHQDDVLSTSIEPSDSSYEYRFRIHPGQPPGLYWYHPHPHGFSESQVLGGASGALIVEGIEKAKPAVAGLPERILVLRDQAIPGTAGDADDGARPAPAKDLSINFVPILYPADRPAALVAKPNRREFWRILNAAADTYFDLEIRTGPSLREVRAPLTLEVIAIDGAPIASDAVERRTHVFLPPGARAEVIAAMPLEGVFAQLVTLGYDAGPDGERTPARPLANLFASSQAPELPYRIPDAPAGPDPPTAGLLNAAPAAVRRLYFSEEARDPAHPARRRAYFLTVEGKTPRAFDMHTAEPDITAAHGTVEDWVIENRATEAHTFHIHQIHFQLIGRDGRAESEPFLRDTVEIPYWDGKNPRYPSVKLRMDFRDAGIVGTFPFHCHILEHEDGGMMGTIRVK